MNPLRYLLYRLNPPPPEGAFCADSDVTRSLKELAWKEGRSEQEIAAEMLAAALNYQREAEEKLQLYWNLTPRERQVVALACQELSNQEIADRLVLSVETVRTHIRNILVKGEVRSKNELRRYLIDWDFASCEKDPDSIPRLIANSSVVPDPAQGKITNGSWLKHILAKLRKG